MANEFFNNAGNAATYRESPTVFLPSVLLGAALDGMASLPNRDVATSTGLLVRKDADNFQLWNAGFEYDQQGYTELYLSGSPLQSFGTLSYGDAVEVIAVPIAEMLAALQASLDADAAYPVVESGETVTLTVADHFGKVVLLTATNPITLTFDTAYAPRAYHVHLVQCGGQITLAAASNRNFNGQGANLAYTIPDVAYQKIGIFKGAAWNDYIVTA